MVSTLESPQQIEKQFRGNTIQAMPLPVDREVANALQGDNRQGVALSALNWMNPCNRSKFSREIASNHKRKIDWRNDKNQREKYSEKIRLSLSDRKVRQELAAYREFELRSDAIALPFALGAFQQVNLSEDELPLIITPKTRQYFNVNWIGQDGGARQAQWEDARTAEMHAMKSLSTEKVEVPVYDIQQGNVNRLSDVQAQLRFDMDMEIDEEARRTIDSLITVSGLRDLLHYHKYVVQANVPDTNYLDLNAIDTAGELSITKLKRILRHVASFSGLGLSIEDDIALTISSMVVSPQNIEDSWDFIDIVSGWDSSGQSIIEDPLKTVPTGVREQIFNTGMMNSAWGYTWNMVPNARLAKGRIYVFMNNPVGWFFTKTAFDQLLVWDGPDQQEQNYIQTVWKRVLAFVCPDLWKHRILIVDL